MEILDTLKFYFTGDPIQGLIAKISEPGDFRELASLINRFAEILEDYNECKSALEQAIKDEISQSNILGIDISGELGFDCRDIDKLKTELNGRFLKIYRYRTGSVLPEKEHMRFKIKDSILASDNIDDLIYDASEDDVWGVSLGMLIEKAIDLSYFVITMSCCGNVFIVTDKIDYENPDQIDALMSRGSRGTRRFSEDREKFLEFLPYILIDKIIEKRNETGTVAKNAGSEIYTFPLSDYFGWSLYYLMKFSLEKIYDGENFAEIMGAGQLALGMGDESVDMDDNSVFYNCNMELLDKLVDEIYGEYKTTLPAVRVTDIVKQGYYSGQLTTVEKFNKDVKYLAHKNVAEHLERQSQIMQFGEPESGEYRDMSKYELLSKQETTLTDMMARRLERIEPIIFSGDEVCIYDVCHPEIYTTFGREDENYRAPHQLSNTSNKKNYWCNKFVRRSGVDRGYRACDIMCIENCGNRAKPEYSRTMSIMRYTELMAIMGIERDELPTLYRNYLSHIMIPYKGNSILDSVKPEYKVFRSDMLTSDHPNGLHYIFTYCGNCFKKKMKKYRIGENVVAVMNSDKKELVEIIALDEFRKKYNLEDAKVLGFM